MGEREAAETEEEGMEKTGRPSCHARAREEEKARSGRKGPGAAEEDAAEPTALEGEDAGAGCHAVMASWEEREEDAAADGGTEPALLRKRTSTMSAPPAAMPLSHASPRPPSAGSQETPLAQENARRRCVLPSVSV